MLDGAGAAFDPEAVLRAELTPVFFGSAANNFGVQLFLDGFLELAPPPCGREAVDRVIPPEHPSFSGCIFKMQANMDPRHRDTLAFIRVCSGTFTRDMTALHTRTGRTVRIASSHKLFGQDRETVNEAFPGDIIGVVGHLGFHIGDTLTEDPTIAYKAMPRFAPECFGYLHGTGAAQSKRFRQGLEQLVQEGVVQLFHDSEDARRIAILGAVGPLQFDVILFRLETEYGAQARLEPAPWTALRWVGPDADPRQLETVILPGGARLARDVHGQRVILFPNEWTVGYFVSNHPEIPLADTPHGFEASGNSGRTFKAMA
jgi:peptide chain release factor 3